MQQSLAWAISLIQIKNTPVNGDITKCTAPFFHLVQVRPKLGVTLTHIFFTFCDFENVWLVRSLLLL